MTVCSRNMLLSRPVFFLRGWNRKERTRLENSLKSFTVFSLHRIKGSIILVEEMSFAFSQYYSWVLSRVAQCTLKDDEIYLTRYNCLHLMNMHRVTRPKQIITNNTRLLQDARYCTDWIKADWCLTQRPMQECQRWLDDRVRRINRLRCYSIVFDRCLGVSNQPFDKPRRSHWAIFSARDVVLLIILEEKETKNDHHLLRTRYIVLFSVSNGLWSSCCLYESINVDD